MSKCVICAADKMIVGRWYKLVTYPIGYNTDTFPWKYTVTYKCDSDIVCLLHDTLYIKSAGEFAVTVVDEYGNTDAKTIVAVEEPVVDRIDYDITVESWEDFKEKITEIGEYAKIKINNDVTFDFTETAFTIPEGTLIDFDCHIVYLTSAVSTFSGFNIMYDYSGICNVNFVGVDMYKNETYLNTSTIITTQSGYCCCIENITFKDTAGYNVAIGGWPQWNNEDMYEKRHYGKWSTEYADIINGCIEDDGNVNVDTTECWTHTDTVNVYETEDRSYYVGRSSMFIPSTVRLYDIAFYDSDGNLLELKRDCQYFRKYYYPEGAVYVRFAVWQTNQPEEAQPRDDYGVMRMMGGITGYRKALVCEELMVSNIRAYNSASGVMSIVGCCTDLHLNRICVTSNGWSNAWAFDMEDCWNSLCGCVISHSYFADGKVIFYGAQGVTLISSMTGWVQTANNVHFVTIINSLLERIYTSGIRCNATTINSYRTKWQVADENDVALYDFGLLDGEVNTKIRNIAKRIIS